MPRAGGIGVRQLIHQDEPWTPRHDGIHVHFGQHGALVADLTPRDNFEAGDQRFRLGPAMCFDIADDHIHALIPALVRSFEHGVGLADTGRVAQEDLQRAARLARLFRLDARQEFIGVGTGALVGHGYPMTDDD